MRKLIPMIALIFLAVSIMTVSAEETPAGVTVIDLSTAITYAKEFNSQLKMAEHSMLQAKEKEREAAAALWPQLGVSLSYAEMLEPYSGPTPKQPETLYATQLSVSQTLFASPVRLQYILAQKAYQLKQVEYAEARDELVYNVTNAYYQAVKAKLGVAIAESSLEQALKNLKISEAHYKAGMITKNQLLQMELAVAKSRQNLLQAENMYRLSLAGLKNLIGMDQGVTLALSESPDFPENVVNEADRFNPENRYDVKKAQLSVEMAEIGVRMAQSGYYPVASLGVTYSTAGSDFFTLEKGETRITLGLQWSFNLKGKTRAAVQAAEAELAAAREMLKLSKDGGEFAYTQAMLEWTEAGERTKLSALTLEVAKENYRLAAKRYEVGVGTVQEVNEAQIALEQAEINALNARYDLFLGGLKLKRAMGLYN